MAIKLSENAQFLVRKGEASPAQHGIGPWSTQNLSGDDLGTLRIRAWDSKFASSPPGAVRLIPPEIQDDRAMPLHVKVVFFSFLIFENRRMSSLIQRYFRKLSG